MNWIFIGIVFVNVVTTRQKETDNLIAVNTNTQSFSSNIWTAKLPATNIGGFKYQDGEVILLQNQLKSSDFFFTPFPYIEPNLTECFYNDFDDQTELTLFVSLYTTNLLEAIEQDIKKHHQDICIKQRCKVSLLPMHSIRLFQKGRRDSGSKKKYSVDSEWQSNTQLRQTVEFTIQMSNMSVCETIRDSISTRCRLSNFELHYTLEGQQTTARTIEVTTEHITGTAMYNKIKSAFPSNEQNTVALTGHDYKSLVDETIDQIKMNIRIDEGYESIQDPIGIDSMLDRQLKLNQISLTRLNDNLWSSLYWTSDLTRPDRVAKVLNKILKQDATDSNRFLYDYSQLDDELKQTLTNYDTQKYDNLAKQLTSQSPNTTNIADGSLSTDPITGFVINTQRYNRTSNDRKNATSISLQRNDAEKLVQYFSEHVEIEGDMIKPKPIDVKIVKFGSLRTNTKLFSNTVYVKTRMNVHILPLRCPYKYRYRASATWLEESHRHLSNIVDNLTVVIDHKYDQLSNTTDEKYNRLLTSVDSFQDLVDRKYDQLSHLVDNSTNVNKKKLNHLSNIIDHFTSVASALNGTLLNSFHRIVEEFKLSTNHSIESSVSSMQMTLIQEIDKNQLETNSVIRESSKYVYENLMGNIAPINESINSTLVEILNVLDEKITNNTETLYTLMAKTKPVIIDSYNLSLRIPESTLPSFAQQNSIESITVIQNNPLKVKVQLVNGWWFQGMVCDDHFNATAAMVACRSRNYTVSSASFSTVTWEQNNQCQYGFGPNNQMATNYQCKFILDDISCTSNGYSSLKDCQFSALFSHNCGNGEHIDLICY